MKSTSIQKWGNSYAVRIPIETIENLKLSEGQSVEILESNDKTEITIRPTKAEELSLKEMVARITSENTHPETDWGPAVGKEVW